MIPSPRAQLELKHNSTGVANMLCNQITVSDPFYICPGPPPHNRLGCPGCKGVAVLFLLCLDDFIHSCACFHYHKPVATMHNLLHPSTWLFLVQVEINKPPLSSGCAFLIQKVFDHKFLAVINYILCTYIKTPLVKQQELYFWILGRKQIYAK